MKRSILAATTALLALSGATTALGSGGDDDEVRNPGNCSGSSSSEIKAKPDDGRLEVEFEVDQNKAGDKWKVKLKDNSEVVFRGSATTRGASGSFSIERKIPDRSVSDKIKGVARNRSTDERCSATVTI
jgi:hypothetical protein